MRNVKMKMIAIDSRSLAHSSPIESVKNAKCVDITNDGLGSITRPKKEAMDMWGEVREFVEPYIIDEYWKNY